MYGRIVCPFFWERLSEVRKSRTVIGIQDPWNAAHLPCRFGLAPDGLAQGERGVKGAGRLKGHHVAGHGTAILIKNDREPGFPRTAFLIGEQNVEQGVVGLPDDIGRIRFAAVQEILGVAVDLAALMGQCHQGGVKLSHDVVDHVVAGDMQALCRGEGRHLPMDRCDGGCGLLQGERFHQLGEGWEQRSAGAFIDAWLTPQRSEAPRAIALYPSSCSTEGQGMMLGEGWQRHTLFQKRTDDMKPPQCGGAHRIR
jgi:hypothetical protein